MFDWARSNLTGTFDWARSVLTRLFDWVSVSNSGNMDGWTADDVIVVIVVVVAADDDSVSQPVSPCSSMVVISLSCCRVVRNNMTSCTVNIGTIRKLNREIGWE